MAEPSAGKSKLLARGNIDSLQVVQQRIQEAAPPQKSVMRGDSPESKKDWRDALEFALNFTPAAPAAKLAPALLGTLVDAKPFLKGMKGVHPGFDLEAFLKAEALAPNAKALESKFGIFRTDEGLKTNISDRGMNLKEQALDRLMKGEQLTVEEALHMPNQATIEAAVGDPYLFKDMVVSTVTEGTAQGRYNPIHNSIKLNVDKIADVTKDSRLGLDREVAAVLGHEGLGHGIQTALGWQNGANKTMAMASPEFQRLFKAKITDSGAPDMARDALISPYVTKQKLSSLTPQQKEQFASDIIADQVYRKFMGEQGAEAPMKVFRLGEENPGLDPFYPVTNAFETPLINQLLK
jgi:hypothetical protein